MNQMNVPIRIPDGFVDELKARIRPSEVIGRKVKLKKQGKEWVGLSPFTNEKTPSFYVNDQKKIFKCFSSGIGGDVISFVMETERLSFMEAVEKLADEAGMALPKATPESQEQYDRRLRLIGASEAAAAFYEERLRSAEGAEARRYLEGRGLKPGSWGKYRLGYSPNDWRKTFEHLRSKGFSQSEIVEAGLAVEKDGGGDPYDRFRGRLMFPIEDARGQVIAFGGRALQPDAKPKYLNSSDTPLFHKSRVLYRYKAAREAFGGTEEGGLIVCEGYMDVIALCEAGFEHAVAPLGTALTEEQLGLLWRAGPEPVLCFDGDRAGLGAAYRSIERALPGLQPGRSVFFCLLSDGMDPDDLIRERGPGAMGKLLDSALPLVEVLWRRERDAEAVDTPERQAGLEQRLMQAASAIQHSAVKSAYERELKARMRDYLWQLRAAGRGSGRARVRGDKPLDASLRGGAPAKTRGLGLIVRAVDHHHLAEIGFEALAVADLPDPDVSAIRDALISQNTADSGVDRKGLSDHLESLGKTRAAELLTTYPDTPQIAPGGPEEREWLIALEQYARPEGTDGSGRNSGEAFATPEDARFRHRLVSERRARTARLNEAAEKADQ
ncbi:MAG: DNA primase, partial [Hyphomonas sp.]|nr:DNA primase [Hyphomonas sp.]